ncbi:hypothetical protein EZE46_05775 [Bacillus sp. BH2]|uniref:hypothetical protein n=1 Tax=Bacillus sp. BH2 TaxID=2528958 RepID=UPI0010651A10|nr:hypothetical protein [Bacillus sp. BH2]TEA54634.1 hypothetical protein EZE46_05775 [Bacillus sp. BH2]
MKKCAITNEMVCCSYIKPNHIKRDVFANSKIDFTIKEAIRKDTKGCITSNKLVDRGTTVDKLAKG